MQAAPPAVATHAVALTSSSGGSSRTHTLAASAKASYLQFIWGLSFGLIATVATPFLALVAVLLGVGKSVHDAMRTRTK